jgi:hypothetical protein
LVLLLLVLLLLLLLRQLSATIGTENVPISFGARS